MSRQEEFNDIPSLGSARDELDQSEIPTLKPVDQPQRSSATAPARKASNGLVYFLLAMLILALAGVAYWSFERSVQLEAKLAAADVIAAESQSRIADIEALVNAADESANKSGAALQAQMRKQLQDSKVSINNVNSEIRKLWAVYQKFSPAIAELQKQQKQHSSALASQQSELKTVGGSLDTIGLSLDKQTQALSKTEQSFSKLDKSLSGLQKSSDQQLGQLKEQLSEQLRTQDLTNQEVDDLQTAQLNEMQKSLQALQTQPQVPANLQSQIREHQSALESITSFRKQVNSKLLNLQRRIGQLQSTVGTGATQ